MDGNCQIILLVDMSENIADFTGNNKERGK